MDRLRRLDALFAERVLGCKVVYDWSLPNKDHDPGCGCNGNPHSNSNTALGDTGSWDLAYYTRSLDAAWEGGLFCHVSYSDNPAMPKYLAMASTGGRDRQRGEPFATGEGRSDDHPAEALVLACLLAVGVSEDEPKD